MAQESYKYPRDLGTTAHPSVIFLAQRTSQRSNEVAGSVSLYMPEGVSFSDGAGFATFDMGVLTPKILDTLGQAGQAAQTGNLEQLTKAAAAGAVNSITGSSGSTKAALLLNKAAKAGIPGAQAAQRLTGKVANPNTTTAFQNMALRTFQFQFKLVPDRVEDSTTIKSMTDFFRRNMYASRASGGYLLQYPSTFRILFSNQQHYPAIAETYLTDMSVSYNSQNGLPMEDGAPADVDVQLTFQETRVLTREDIEALSRGEFVGTNYNALIENVAGNLLDSGQRKIQNPNAIQPQQRKTDR